MAGTITTVPLNVYQAVLVSMESGLDGRNNRMGLNESSVRALLSQWSPA